MPVLPFPIDPKVIVPTSAEQATAPPAIAPHAFDEAAIRKHVEMLHSLAEGIDGVLILAGYGQNPTNRRDTPTRVERFQVGKVDAMVDAVMSWQHIAHLNAYAPWTVFRKTLEPHKKGGEDDAVAVLAVVADLDADTGKAGDAPIDPPYLIETSAGNYQAFYPFEEPLTLTGAKPLAIALADAAGCDHGTKDISHVWRIPGTLNWPNFKKLERGRAAQPQMVKVAQPWTGELIAPTTLAGLKPIKPAAEAAPVVGDPSSLDTLLARCGAVLRHVIASSPLPNEDRSATAFGVIASFVRKGFSDVDIVALVKAHPQGIGARYSEGKDLDADIRRAREKGAPVPAQAPTKPLAIILASSFSGLAVPERSWHVETLIPGSTVTLLSGDGGTGKSLLALQLSVATALGLTWIGHPAKTGPVIHLTAEDETDELHRRLANIVDAMGVELSALSNLHLVSLAGEDAVLASVGRNNVVQATPLWQQIEAAALDISPALVVLDTLADLFAGEENVRTQAQQFVSLLRGLALRRDAAVVMLAHPSVSGMASGTGTSGSTAWSNSVRSRLYLERVIDGEKQEVDPDARVLRTMKSNYGKIGDQIRLRWLSGIFKSEQESQAVKAMKTVTREAAERTFIKMLRAYQYEGRPVSASPSANFAPKVFARDERSNGIGPKAFIAAMNSLFEAKRICLENYGPPSKPRSSLVVANPEKEQLD